LFESRKGHLDYRIKRDFVKNGIATIPCRISSYSDVINSYSVEGCETLNTDFFDYLTMSAEVTPDKYPLVLNIIGDCLSEEEQGIITTVIREDFAYDLGMVEKDIRRHTKTFLVMLLVFVLSGILIMFTSFLSEVPRELIFLLFWFTGETVCDYLFLTGHDLRRSRRLAGRLASIKVVFSSKYTAPNYTQRDFDQLYSEIEKDVIETIEEEGMQQ